MYFITDLEFFHRDEFIALLTFIFGKLEISQT